MGTSEGSTRKPLVFPGKVFLTRYLTVTSFAVPLSEYASTYAITCLDSTALLPFGSNLERMSGAEPMTVRTSGSMVIQVDVVGEYTSVQKIGQGRSLSIGVDLISRSSATSQFGYHRCARDRN